VTAAQCPSDQREILVSYGIVDSGDCNTDRGQVRGHALHDCDPLVPNEVRYPKDQDLSAIFITLDDVCSRLVAEYLSRFCRANLPTASLAAS
jgi:hypothetical protein